MGTVQPGAPFGINTYEDHVFQFRDGSQVLSTLRMFRTRVVIALDLDFMSSMSNCEDLPHESYEGSCEDWARQGQCVVNPGFMHLDGSLRSPRNMLISIDFH